MKNLIILLLSVVFIVGCNSQEKKTEPTTTEGSINLEPKDLKSIAMKAQDAFFVAYSADGIKKYFKEDYIQHNLSIPTGRQFVIGLLPTLKQAKTSYTTHRILQDGDFIVLHNTYNNAEPFGAKEIVAFDVWRMEDGKVAEHWDNTGTVTPPNPSGRTQVDGPTKVMDKDKTDANKKLVKDFITNIFVNGKGDITNYISTKEYLQHNSQGSDGLDGLSKAMKYFEENGLEMTYTKLQRVLGEGNFVLAISEGTFGKGEHVAYYDLFRLEDNKIVEHWDVIQSIPPKSEWKNENGKF